MNHIGSINGYLWKGSLNGICGPSVKFIYYYKKDHNDNHKILTIQHRRIIKLNIV